MKKIYFFLAMLSTFFVKAQIYCPMLDTVNRWSYVINAFPILSHSSRGVDAVSCYYPFGQDIMYTYRDTIFNSVVYKKLYADFNLGVNPCLFGYLREDTSLRRVYFKDTTGSAENILYDFSMHIGDTIPLTFYGSGLNAYFENGKYRLDSISTVIVQSGIRPAYYLNCDTCSSSHTLMWIESVGNLANMVYTYSPNYLGFGPFTLACSQGFPHDHFQFLICFEHNQKVYYDTCAYQHAVNNFCFAVLDTCDYYNTCGSVSEVANSFITLSPNPFHSATALQIQKGYSFQNGEIKIFNALGCNVRRQLIRNPGAEIIERASLNDGIYFYEIRNGDGELIGRGKIVVD